MATASTESIIGTPVTPVAGTLSDLYTPPATVGSYGSKPEVSGIVVCNTDAAETTFSLARAVHAAADDKSQYYFKDKKIGGNRTVTLSWDPALKMNSDDVWRGSSANGLVSFNFEGTVGVEG